MKNIIANGVRLDTIFSQRLNIKTVKAQGVTVWQRDQNFPSLVVPEFYNYEGYHMTLSGISIDSIDVRGFSILTFTWSLTTTMSWSNAYGVSSTSRLYLRLGDDTTVLIGSKSGTLFGADTKYEDSGTATINLSEYSDVEKSSIKLYAELGNMSAPTPQYNADRHNLSASTGLITAS